MAGEGTGVITQVAFNSGGVTAAVPKIEDFTYAFAPDEFTPTSQAPQERGSGIGTLMGNILDYSAFSSLATLMGNRTETDAVYTYRGGGTGTVNPCRLKVTPILNTVGGIDKVLLGASGASNNNLDAETGWTDLGTPYGDINPQVSAEAGFDGNRRYYYKYCRLEHQVILPDIAVGDLSAFSIGEQVKLAFKIGADLYLVYDNVFLSFSTADQNSDDPLSVRLRVTGTHSAWSSLFQFHNGSAAEVTEPGDFFYGCRVEAQAFGLAESDFLTFA